MTTGSASEFLILWSYVIISLGLILSPFFILWWKKIRKWRWIFLAYFLSIVIFAGIFCLDSWYDRYLYNNVYNSGWLMQVLLQGSLNLFLCLCLLWTMSPFFIAKIKYKKFTWKRSLTSLLFSFVIAVILLVIWGYFVVWSLGQVGMLYF